MIVTTWKCLPKRCAYAAHCKTCCLGPIALLQGLFLWETTLYILHGPLSLCICGHVVSSPAGKLHLFACRQYCLSVRWNPSVLPSLLTEHKYVHVYLISKLNHLYYGARTRRVPNRKCRKIDAFHVARDMPVAAAG